MAHAWGACGELMVGGVPNTIALARKRVPRLRGPIKAAGAKCGKTGCAIGAGDCASRTLGTRLF